MHAIHQIFLVGYVTDHDFIEHFGTVSHFCFTVEILQSRWIDYQVDENMAGSKCIGSPPLLFLV